MRIVKLQENEWTNLKTMLGLVQVPAGTTGQQALVFGTEWQKIVSAVEKAQPEEPSQDAQQAQPEEPVKTSSSS